MRVSFGPATEAAGFRRTWFRARLLFWLPSAEPKRKIDRGSLPAPEVAGEWGVRGAADLWRRRWRRSGAKVLRVDRVGIDDDFFDLGVILLWRRGYRAVADVFEIELPLRALFEGDGTRAWGAG